MHVMLAAAAFIIIPMMWAVNQVFLKRWFTYTHWISVVSHIWLLYFYVSLALRENILLVNGSRIRGWWITHHYISALTSIVMLTWPLTPIHESFIPMFTWYFAYQALVMIAQAWYQSGRHYHLVATGKATTMDVTNPEGLREFHISSVLVILVVMLCIAYAIQVYMSIELLRTANEQLVLWQNPMYYREEIQVVAVGVAFMCLAIGNSVSLYRTMAEKCSPRSRLTSSSSTSSGGDPSTPAPAIAARIVHSTSNAALAAAGAAADASDAAESSDGVPRKRSTAAASSSSSSSADRGSASSTA